MKANRIICLPILVIGIFLFFAVPLSLAIVDNVNNENANEDNTNNTELNSVEEAKEDETLLELNFQIQERKQHLEELNSKHENYRNNLSIKRQEAQTLEIQMTSIEDQIGKTEIEIEITETEIETLRLQIREITKRIQDREEQIINQKTKLSELIRQLNKRQDKNLFEIMLREEKFSSFYTQLNYLEELERGLKKSLDEVTQLKIDLQVIGADLENKERDMNDKKVRLEAEKDDLDSQKTYKFQLLEQTLSTESKYQDLLDNIRREQMEVNTELALIEETVKKKLEGDDLLIDDTKVLSWPVSPIGGITAYFHDPSYPFRHIYEHDAIDIRAKQGTPVKAAASGYVVVANDNGFGYSWIAIFHGNGIMTVYGHISSIKVNVDDYVTRGQIIGLSGGMPGTLGAGYMTTGPHLHFGVKKDGFPVNPLDYLP